MKRWISLSGGLLAITISSWAAQPSPDVAKAVMKAEESWRTAVLKSDKTALDKLLAPDLSYTHSSGKTQTKEQFIEDATGGSTIYKAIDFSDTKLRQYGNVVVITHPATIVSEPTGTSHLYLTEVWAKEGGQWQMASRHASKITQ